MSFDNYFDRLIGHEGGYVNDARDSGGETNWGISKRAYPHLNIKELTREQAKDIYRRDYWGRMQGDLLPTEVAFQVFDAAVNHGIGNAIRWLQRAAGVADDGHLGPISLGSIRSKAPVDLVLLFNAERLDFYTKLSGWEVYGKGWVRRVSNNLRYAADDID